MTQANRYFFGQSGADIGTCSHCGMRKVLRGGLCSKCRVPYADECDHSNPTDEYKICPHCRCIIWRAGAMPLTADELRGR